jgi:hypothetical protein
VVGVDDGAFRRRDRTTPVVGVVFSGPSYIDAILTTRIEVDGSDSTDQIAGMLRGSPHLEGVRAVLLDGIAVGGFNIIDLNRLNRLVDRPILALTRRPPEFPRIRAALAKYFPREFRRRWALVRALPLYRVPTGGAPIWAASVGCRKVDALSLIRRTLVRGYWPEPLRVAHLVASACATPRPTKSPGVPRTPPEGFPRGVQWRPNAYGRGRVSFGPGL